MNSPSQISGHDLVSDIVYGPVFSRRYGHTFGINLLPLTRKCCTFNCVYCQLGFDFNRAQDSFADFSRTEEIFSAVNALFQKHIRESPVTIDHIVLSGNGEPTLHPDFSVIVKNILDQRRQSGLNIPVVCFTNGSRLAIPEIRNSLISLDECCVKLDAGLKKIDLPNPSFDMIPFLKSMVHLPNLVIQSCFVTGSASNVSEGNILEWLEWLSKIQPCRVDLYTVSRKTAKAGLVAVSTGQLQLIAEKLKKKNECQIRICA